MTYYIVAGERSGDLHAGNLVKALSKRDPDAKFFGFGGEYMKAAGVTLTVDYNELAFMGLIEVVINLNKINRYTDLCKNDILEKKPDVVILVDYGGFNGRIARFAKPRGIKVFYYITPKVWAWYQARAKMLKANVDRMFVILPFEKDFYKTYDWNVDYVGNPVLDAVKAHVPRKDFHSRYGLQSTRPLIALLPGSRKQELQRILPLMARVIEKNPDYQFAVAAVSNLDKSLYNTVSALSNVVLIEEDTYDLLLHATSAIVTSGTATLETALFKVPQVVVYKANRVSYFLAKFLVKVDFISLVNLIAGKEIVRELLQSEANDQAVSLELKRITEDEVYRQTMLSGYDRVYKTLDIGSASENTAGLMVKYLKED